MDGSKDRRHRARFPLFLKATVYTFALSGKLDTTSISVTVDPSTSVLDMDLVANQELPFFALVHCPPLSLAGA
jgi:hypothetical protein